MEKARMEHHPVRLHRNVTALRNRSDKGFTVLEMVFVVVIVLIMTTMAVPLITNVIATYRMRSAVASVTGIIQATRFQAISASAPYQIVFTKATSTFQIQSAPDSVSPYTNYCVPAATSCPVPLSNSGVPVTLGADTTLQFRPSGIVSAPVGSTTLTLTYGGKTETISVTSYGNIKVTP